MAPAWNALTEANLRRLATYVTPAVCVCVLGGCFGGSASDDTESEDPSAGWEAPSDSTKKQAAAYLENNGSHLLTFSKFAADLPSRLDDKAYATKCAKLRRRWQQGFGRSRMARLTTGNPDPVLARLLTGQFVMVERSLRRCGDGKRNASEEDAAVVARVDEMVERRMAELEVER